MIRNVYIVDDDYLIRTTLTRLLMVDWALVCRGYASGDLFLAEAPDLESGVVLLDFRMPGSDGVEVLKAIQAMSAHKFAVIVATGEGDTQLAVKMMKLGAVDFIEKPYEVDALKCVVDAAFIHLAQDQSAANCVSAAQAKIAELSPRERDVLVGLIAGQANKVIAHNLDISPRTVEVYRANLMDKLSVNSLPAALRIAFTAGLIPLTL